MSEALNTANLVLGIIGTVTGSIAVIIHIWRLRKENPRLEAEAVKCEHDYTVSKSGIKTISFWTDFMIKNIGDRGTSINDIDLDFEEDGQKYHLKKQFFMWRPAEEKRIWISPHETLDLSVSFYQTFQGKERETIDCHFIVYHTHGAENLKTVSLKRKEKQ
jgi:hypothetical protein